MDSNKIEEQDIFLWEKTKRLDTFLAYRKYLKSFPKGQFHENALKRIDDFRKIEEAEEENLWNEMSKIGNYTSFLRYKLTYPHGKYIAEVDDKLIALKPNDDDTANDSINEPKISKPIVIVPLTFTEKDYWWLWIPIIGWIPFAIPLIFPLGPVMVGFSFSNKMRFVWEAAAHNGDKLPDGVDSFISGFYTLGYNTVLRTYEAVKKMHIEETTGYVQKIPDWNPLFLPIYILCPAFVYMPLIRSMQQHWEWHLQQKSANLNTGTD